MLAGVAPGENPFPSLCPTQAFPEHKHMGGGGPLIIRPFYIKIKDIHWKTAHPCLILKTTSTNSNTLLVFKTPSLKQTQCVEITSIQRLGTGGRKMAHLVSRWHPGQAARLRVSGGWLGVPGVPLGHLESGG